MRNIPYWLNIGSILHQYGCATRVIMELTLKRIQIASSDQLVVSFSVGWCEIFPTIILYRVLFQIKMTSSDHVVSSKRKNKMAEQYK